LWTEGETEAKKEEMESPYSRSSDSWWGKQKQVAQEVVCQALIHSPWVLTFFAGSEWPKWNLTVPRVSMFHVRDLVVKRDERMLSRLMALPLIMESHSELGQGRAEAE
jgi:hypothetical protein